MRCVAREVVSRNHKNRPLLPQARWWEPMQDDVPKRPCVSANCAGKMKR